MVNAVPNLQLELPVPVQSAQASSSSSSPSAAFGKIKDSVFEAFGLKVVDMKEVDSAAALDPALMAFWFMTPTMPQTDSAPEETTQISRCTDPAQGIAGILEGFGLLNADGTLSSEAQELLQAAYDAATEGMPEAPPAGMPVVPPEAQGFAELLNGSGDAAQSGEPSPAPMANTQNTASHEAAVAFLAPLLSDYLRSLENAHSRPAADAALPQDTPLAAVAVAGTETMGDKAASALEKLASAIQNAFQTGGVPAAEAAASAQETAGVSNESTVKEAEKPFKTTADAADSMQASMFRQVLTEASGRQTAPMTAPETAAAPQADMGETVLNLVESMHAMSQEGASEFEVTLKPEYLGKLSIKLTQDGDGLKAQIKAADAAVKGMLENELSSLQSMLREKGVQVTKIDVSYEAFTLAFNGGQPSRNQQRNGAQENKNRLSVLNVSRASVYGGVAETSASDSAAQDSARLVLQGSSVEFSA